MTGAFNQDLGPRQSYYRHVPEHCSWNERNLVDFFCNHFPLSFAAAVGIDSQSCLLIRRAVYPIHFTHLPISIILISSVPSSLTSLPPFAQSVTNPLHLLMAVVSPCIEKWSPYWHFWGRLCVLVTITSLSSPSGILLNNIQFGFSQKTIFSMILILIQAKTSISLFYTKFSRNLFTWL